MSVYDLLRWDPNPPQQAGGRRRLLSPDEFLRLVERLPVGSHFRATRTAGVWSSVSLRDLSELPPDNSPEAWRDWTSDRFLSVSIVNEIRALFTLVHNMFANSSNRLDMDPAYRPGNTPPGYAPSPDSGETIILKHLF